MHLSFLFDVCRYTQKNIGISSAIKTLLRIVILKKIIIQKNGDSFKFHNSLERVLSVRVESTTGGIVFENCRLTICFVCY